MGRIAVRTGHRPAARAGRTVTICQIGAMATLTLAVMTRATPGHTGRLLSASRATQFISTAICCTKPPRRGQSERSRWQFVDIARYVLGVRSSAESRGRARPLSRRSEAAAPHRPKPLQSAVPMDAATANGLRRRLRPRSTFRKHTSAWPPTARGYNQRHRPSNQAAWREPSSPRILLEGAIGRVSPTAGSAGVPAAHQRTAAPSIRHLDFPPIDVSLLRIEQYLQCRDRPERKSHPGIERRK